MPAAPIRTVDDIRESWVGDRLVLFHARADKALVLNPTGAWLWSRIAASPTAEQLGRDLRGRYPELGDAQAAGDVDAFIAELRSHGLLAE